MKANIDYKLLQDNEDALTISYKGIFHIYEEKDTENNIDIEKYEVVYTSEGVKNTLEIDNKEKTVKIINQNEMFFKKGLDKKIKYQTAYGIIDLRLVTNELIIEHNKDDKKLHLNLKYYLYQGPNPLVNDLDITISY